MISFKTISIFRRNIERLLKVKRGVYSGVENEIRNIFKGVAIDDIRKNRDTILYKDDSIVIKLRIPDHKNHLSKSDGFRLLYLVYNEFDTVILLDIYPKRGPLQKLDLTQEEYLNIYNTLDKEDAENALGSYEIE